MSKELDDFYRNIDLRLENEKLIKSRHQLSIEDEINLIHDDISKFSINIKSLDIRGLLDYQINLTMLIFYNKTLPQENQNKLKFKIFRIKNFRDELIKLEQKKRGKENQYPDIFDCENNNAFILFKIYSRRHIIETVKDYSFIFQKMLSENLIRDTKHKTFIKWLKRNNHIDDSEYNKLMIEGSFISLPKSENYNRLHNYNFIKKEIFK